MCLSSSPLNSKVTSRYYRLILIACLIWFIGMGCMLSYHELYWQEEKTVDSTPLLKEKIRNLNKDFSPSKFIQLENRNDIEEMKRTKQKVFSHWYLHIPKTAGFGVFTKLMNLIGQGIFKDIKPKDWLYRPCKEGITEVKNFGSKFHRMVGGTLCNFWMSEDQLTGLKTKPRHMYTVIRAPHQHVLSQYFHCTESWEHIWYQRLQMHFSWYMPPLDEWLDHHLKSMEFMSQTGHKLDNNFNCYDPINLQSQLINFDATMTVADLKKTFDVIGTVDQIEKFACAVTIRYTGVVPPPCDCTNNNRTRTRWEHTNNNKTRNLGVLSSIWARISNNVSENEDHGVKNHGSSFNATTSQAGKIARLTQLDSLLYKRAKLAFAEQVLEIEEGFGIKMC